MELSKILFVRQCLVTCWSCLHCSGITHQASERAGWSSGPEIAPAPADNNIS